MVSGSGAENTTLLEAEKDGWASRQHCARLETIVQTIDEDIRANIFLNPVCFFDVYAKMWIATTLAAQQMVVATSDLDREENEWRATTFRMGHAAVTEGIVYCCSLATLIVARLA